MYSNMCVKIAVCLTLVACVNSHVIKQHDVPLPADGVLLEFTVKNKADGKVMSEMKIDIQEKDKKLVISMGETVPVDVGGSTTEFVPVIGNRNNIRVGTCPIGYVRRGGFCFPDDDY